MMNQEELTDAELECIVAGKGPMLVPALMIAYSLSSTAALSKIVKNKEKNAKK